MVLKQKHFAGCFNPEFPDWAELLSLLIIYVFYVCLLLTNLIEASRRGARLRSHGCVMGDRPLMLHKHRLKWVCPSKSDTVLLYPEKREWKHLRRLGDGQAIPAAPFQQLGGGWQWWSAGMMGMAWKISLFSLPGVNHYSRPSTNPALLLATCVR